VPMAPRPGSIRPIVGLLMLALGAAGAYNVLGDNTALRVRAEGLACQGSKSPCKAAPARLLRTPFFQELDFRVAGKTVRIRCNRSLYLVGAYQCTRQEVP
jgi:hypothetical protein